MDAYRASNWQPGSWPWEDFCPSSRWCTYVYYQRRFPPERGLLCTTAVVCASVLLCVCVFLLNKTSPEVKNGFWWIFWSGGACPRDQSIRVCWRRDPVKGSWMQIRIQFQKIFNIYGEADKSLCWRHLVLTCVLGVISDCRCLVDNDAATDAFWRKDIFSLTRCKTWLVLVTGNMSDMIDILWVTAWQHTSCSFSHLRMTPLRKLTVLERSVNDDFIRLSVVLSLQCQCVTDSKSPLKVVIYQISAPAAAGLASGLLWYIWLWSNFWPDLADSSKLECTWTIYSWDEWI